MVTLGNHAKMSVIRKRNMQLSLEGVNHLVTKVFYVPALRNNLLTIGQLQEKGLAILLHSNK